MYRFLLLKRTLAPWAIDFSACEADKDCFRMFGGETSDEEVELLRIIGTKEMGLDFGDAHELVFKISKKDLGFGNWKKHQVSLK